MVNCYRSFNEQNKGMIDLFGEEVTSKRARHAFRDCKISNKMCVMYLENKLH